MKHGYRLIPRESIPAHGTQPTPRDAPEATYRSDGKRQRNAGYIYPLRDFKSGDFGSVAEVSWSGVHPDTLRNSLISTMGHHGIDGVRVVKRGDRVYLTDTLADSLLAETHALLESFDASGERTAVVTVPEGTDITRLYRSLHSRRTRRGLGHIRVSRDGDTITLTDTMRED
jgi:hypothetical protein